MKIINIKIGSKKFKVKDCRGISSIRGLMFDDIKNYDGALISGGSVWMPFVKKPLKLLFLDKNFKVVRSDNAVPITFNPSSWKSYIEYNAAYCLEIKDIKLKIKNGVKIKIINNA